MGGMIFLVFYSPRISHMQGIVYYHWVISLAPKKIYEREREEKCWGSSPGPQTDTEGMSHIPSCFYLQLYLRVILRPEIKRSIQSFQCRDLIVNSYQHHFRRTLRILHGQTVIIYTEVLLRFLELGEGSEGLLGPDTQQWLLELELKSRDFFKNCFSYPAWGN